MFNTSTLATARSAANGSGSRRTAQAWPGVNGRAQPGAHGIGARSTAVVLDFPRARDARAVAQIQAPSDNRASLPLADLAIIIGLFLAPALLPVMAWLLVS